MFYHGSGSRKLKKIKNQPISKIRPQGKSTRIRRIRIRIRGHILIRIRGHILISD